MRCTLFVLLKQWMNFQFEFIMHFLFALSNAFILETRFYVHILFQHFANFAIFKSFNNRFMGWKKNEQNEEPHWIQTIDCTQHFVNFDAIKRFWREKHKSMLTLGTLGSKWNGTMIVAWWQVSVMACVYVSSSASHSALCTNVELQFSRLLDAFHLKYISGMPTNANACDTNEPLHTQAPYHLNTLSMWMQQTTA